MVLAISSQCLHVKEVGHSVNSSISPLKSNIDDNKKYYLITVTDHINDEKVLAIFDYTLNALRLKNTLDVYAKENIKLSEKEVTGNLLMVQDKKKYYIDKKQNKTFEVLSKLDLNVIFNILQFSGVSHYFKYKQASS